MGTTVWKQANVDFPSPSSTCLQACRFVWQNSSWMIITVQKLFLQNSFNQSMRAMTHGTRGSTKCPFPLFKFKIFIIIGFVHSVALHLNWHYPVIWSCPGTMPDISTQWSHCLHIHWHWTLICVFSQTNVLWKKWSISSTYTAEVADLFQIQTKRKLEHLSGVCWTKLVLKSKADWYYRPISAYHR